MGMSQSFGPRPPREETITFLRAAVERGVTLFGTAEVDGPFHDEELVGEALQPVRDQVVIATKFSFAFDEHGNQSGVTSRPEHICAAVDGSLRRVDDQDPCTDRRSLRAGHVRVDPRAGRGQSDARAAAAQAHAETGRDRCRPPSSPAARSPVVDESGAMLVR